MTKQENTTPSTATKARKPSKATKKPKRKKTSTRITLKEFLPSYREFQKEAARLESMLGAGAEPDAALGLPEDMTREWAQDAWQVVKADAELQFRPSTPGTEFPSGVYADRAWLATLQMMRSPFNDALKSSAIGQVLRVYEMRDKAAKKRARAERRAATTKD